MCQYLSDEDVIEMAKEMAAKEKWDLSEYSYPFITTRGVMNSLYRAAVSPKKFKKALISWLKEHHSKRSE